MPKRISRPRATARNAGRRPATAKLKAAPGTAMPPRTGAPQPNYPIATTKQPGTLAPPPLVDRYPLIVGQSLTVSYLSSVFRLATTGYRLQLVDMLNELIEHDPHLYSVVMKRILSSANGRLEVVPFEVPEDDPDAEKAEEIAKLVDAEIRRIPDLVQSLAGLLWAVYHGLSGVEIFWTRDGDGWHVDRLGFIHSRRLSYPDPQSWSVHVWDQGQVYGWQTPWGDSPTNTSLYGLCVADYPGKFIIHAPQLRGDYPTRDGVGRETAVWSLFKRVGARGAVDYLERFAKPFMDVSWTTQPDGNPREASEEDIAIASQIAASIGPGSGSYGSHPNSISVDPKSVDGSSSAKLTWPEWIQICDAQESKCVLGGTLGTDVGKGGGNRALGEVQERGEVDIEQYDATTLGETLRRDLVTWIVRLNRPDCLHLVPHIKLHVDADPDPKSIAELAEKLVDMGCPVDADELADEVGIALVPNEAPEGGGELKPRRAYRSDFADPMAVDPSLMSDEAKAQQQADKDAQNELAKTKLQAMARNPPGQPGAQPDDKAAQGAAGGKDKKKGKGKPTEANKKLRDTLLLSDRADKKVATEVFDQLLEDYPRSALDWVLAAHWTGPEEVDVSEMDYSTRRQWRASHEPIEPYIDRIKKGRQKPIILVKTPGKPKLTIVDGHHRALAYERLNQPAIGYVATVHVDEGPWDELHARQKAGSSKGSASWIRDQSWI